MRLNSSIKHYSDKLIYDSSHEIDAGVFTVTLPTESKAAGTVKRGQIIYFDTTKKEYALKKGDDGVAAVIAAEDTSYAEDDTEVAVSAYTSGTFRESECISDGKLEADDIDTLRIEATYPKAKKAMKQLRTNLKKEFEDIANQGISAKEPLPYLNAAVEKALSSVDLGEDAEGISILFENGLSDIQTQMNDLQNQMKQKGIETTSAFGNGINDMEGLAAVSGSTRDALTILGDEIGGNDEWTAIIEACKKNGADIPQEIANGIDENSVKVSGAANRLNNQIKDAFNDKNLSPVITLDMAVNASASSKSDNRVKKLYHTPIGPKQQKYGGRQKTIKAKKNAKGGIYKNPVISMLAEKDNEAVIPLNNSPRSKALYQRTGELLGMSFTDDNTSYQQRRDVRLYNAVKKNSGASSEKVKITYSPIIQVNGNADEKTLTKVVKMSQAEFAKMMQKYMQANKRVKFS